MEKFTPEMRSFLREHSSDDTIKLLFSAARYPGIDVRWAVDQLEARRQLRTKLPEWYAMSDNLVMGGRIPAEQCSSEVTAQYKRQLVLGESLCDLTGGMGVDCYYMSQGLKRALYFERQPHLCAAARHNFPTLGATHIEVHEGDAFASGIPDVDTLYLDPARRATDGSRVYDLADCEPDVVRWRETLLAHCRRLVVKISPMADLSRVLQQMPGVREVHIVAVRNECKEILLVLDGQMSQETPVVEPEIHCVDFRAVDVVRFDFHPSEEERERSCLSPESSEGNDFLQSAFPLQPSAPLYLYEPDVTLFKAGAFRLLGRRMGLCKVDANSHLYLSDRLVPDFPGRTFVIEQEMEFSSRLLKGLRKQLPQANISTRNFPLTADELRQRTGLRDGGEKYLYGTTLRGMGARLLLCRKALLLLLVIMVGCGSLWARKKQALPVETVETLLSGVSLPAPCLWVQGDRFLYLDSCLNATMRPVVPDAAFDTLCYRHTVWTFDGILSEEDWMGQQCMHLQFHSPQGRLYRWNTGRLMRQANDTTYHPAITSLCALAPIEECERRLKGRMFYLMVNDERLMPDCDTLRLEKFVQVRVDSVRMGTELAPLHIWFTHPQGVGSLYGSLPGSRENATSTPVQRLFSLSDPYLKYPNITPAVWSMIRRNEVAMDMSMEEVRLSWGRPQRFEHYDTKGGMIERWHYADRHVVDFVDGRVRRMAIER